MVLHLDWLVMVIIGLGLVGGGSGMNGAGGWNTAPWTEPDPAFDPPPSTDAEFLKTAMFMPSHQPARLIPRFSDDDAKEADCESCHKEAPVRVVVYRIYKSTVIVCVMECTVLHNSDHHHSNSFDRLISHTATSQLDTWPLHYYVWL